MLLLIDVCIKHVSDSVSCRYSLGKANWAVEPPQDALSAPMGWIAPRVFLGVVGHYPVMDSAKGLALGAGSTDFVLV